MDSPSNHTNSHVNDTINDSSVTRSALGLVSENGGPRVSGTELGLVGEASEIVLDVSSSFSMKPSSDGVVKDGEKGLDVSSSVAVVSQLNDSVVEDREGEVSGVVDEKVLLKSSSDAVALDSCLDDRVVGVSGVVKVGGELVDSKKEMLTKETSFKEGGDVVSVDGVRVCGNDLGLVTENGEKVGLESSLDGVVKSVALDGSVDDREVDVSDVVKIGAELVESKTETLVMEASCKGGGDVAQDKVADVRVNGNELGLVTENGEKVLNESSSDALVKSVALDGREVDGSDLVKIGAELVESKTETLTMEASFKGGGDKVADVGEKVLNESSSDALVSSIALNSSEVDASNVVKNGEELVDSKTESLVMESSKEGGDIVRSSVADVKVSGDEVGQKSENVLNESSSDALVSSVEVINSENDVSNVVKNGAELVESKTETLKMETSSKEGGDIVVQDKLDDVRGSDAVVSNRDIDASNGIEVAAELLESKTDTPMMEPSSKESDDVVVQDRSVDTGVNEDEIAVKTDENGVNVDEEKEGEYKVTDLVWAKVRNYPWWPGQIFDPSAATDKAKKYSNKKAFLIAYFGDQSFAWNKASNIKPFRKNFVKMVKQSNSIPFHNAVNCALDEVYRRVEFGLACSCLSEEVVSKFKSQVFVNAGITKEASRIDGGDRFSTVATFKPVNAVRALQDLAREGCDGASRLEALSVKAQLLAYLRWKGYNQFTTEQLEGLDNKLEDESEVQLMEEDKMVEDEKPDSVSEKVSSKKIKSKSGDSGSQKRQHVSDGDSAPRKKGKVLSNESPTGSRTKPASESKKVASKKRKLKSDDSGSWKQQNGDSVPSKKEKASPDVSPTGSPRVFKRRNKSEKNDGKKEIRLTDVTPTGSPSVSKREDRSEKKIGKKELSTDMTPEGSINVFKRKNKSEKNSGKKATVDGKGLMEENRNETVDQKATTPSPKKFLVGVKICKIAKQLSESPSNL